MDLRELAPSRRRYWGDAQSAATFLLLEGHELGCPGSRHPPGRKACASSRSHQMGAREEPYLRRSNDPRLEREAQSVYTVLRQWGPGCLAPYHATCFLHGAH